MITTLQFVISSNLQKGQGVRRLRGSLPIQIYGDAAFLGIAMTTEGERDRQPHTFITRSTASAPVGDEAPNGELRIYTNQTINTVRNPRPFSAASLALQNHLWGYTLESLNHGGVKRAVDTDETYRNLYEEFVVEPLATAVMGLCRDRELRSQVDQAL